MLKPYVERRNNLVKEPANVNVLVSETRKFSNDSRSSGWVFVAKLYTFHKKETDQEWF